MTGLQVCLPQAALPAIAQCAPGTSLAALYPAMPTNVPARRAEGPRPLLKVLVALMIPFVAVITVTGTYFGREVIVTALWAGVGLTAVLFANPLAGILIMTTGYMLASYPSLPQDFGF